MKRLVISLAILVVLAAGGLMSNCHLNTVSGRLSDMLNQAEAMGESGDWEGARQLTVEAQKYWEDSSFYLYTVLRHDYTDEVNTGFHEVLELIQWQASPEYAAANGELITQVRHLSEAEQFNLKNLL